MGVSTQNRGRRLSFIAALSGNVTEELTSALGHEATGGASCRSSNVRNAPVSDGRLKKGGLS